MDIDYTTGFERWWVESDDGSFSIETKWHTDDLIAMNRREASDNGWGKAGWGRKVASIPLGLLEKWHLEDGIKFGSKDSRDAIKRRLNDIDYRDLRVRSGRV